MPEIPARLASHYLSELMRVAARLEVQVRVERLGDAEQPVESGLVRVEDQTILFLDTRLSDREKVQVMARELGRLPTDDLYVKPAIRDLLTRPG